MRKLLFCFALLTVLHGVAQASPPSVAGIWSGAFNVHGTHLPLVLHLTTDAQGALHATVDSPAQGASGIPAESALSGQQLTVTVPSLHATFHGMLSADDKTLTGTWSQNSTLPLVLHQVATETELKNVKPSPIDGNWPGVLHPGSQSLRLVFHFHAMPGDKIAGTVDSLDQHAMGIPCANIQLSGKSLTLDVPAVHGSYSGTLSTDGNKVSGTWTQGAPLPLDLTRAQK